MATDESSPTSAVFQTLPKVVFELVPELHELELKEESRVDCDRCVMLAEHSGAPPDVKWSFHRDARCCTYTPWLPNYSVGQVLQAGGLGASRMKMRLARRSGVTAWGLLPSESSQSSGPDTEGFGRNLSLVCPFFTGEVAACAIWPYRNALCRTWFCKYDLGEAGQNRWKSLRSVLSAAEFLIGRYLELTSSPPAADAEIADYEDWFLQCLHRLNELSSADLIKCDDVRDRRLALDHSRQLLNSALGNAEPVLPSVVLPVSDRHHQLEASIYLVGYSRNDGVMVHPSILRFFVELDGERTWQEAVSRANSQGVMIDNDLVHELFRVGVLKDTNIAREKLPSFHTDVLGEKGTGADLATFLQTEVRDLIIVDTVVWLQSASTLQSMIVPIGMFSFFSKLDDMPWREAFEAAQVEVNEPLDRRLVLELCRIRVLRPQPR